MISNSFVWGDDGKAITPEDARRRREVAMAMIQQGTAGRPIQHWTQGAANVAQALLGAYDMRQADNKESAAREAAKASDAQFLGMIGGGGAAAPAMGGASPNPLANVQPMAMGSDLDRAANAITSIESGGRYDALGPVTKSGDRAFGRYQVMGENIPSWTEQYAGRRMTPQEFLASQEAQDAVFRGEFGRLKQKHGPEGAARAWFAGEGGMNNPNARDILGTSVADYSRKFTSSFAPGDGAAPQVAAAGAATAAPIQQVAQANPQLLQAAMARMNDPYASAGSRAVAQALVQRIISQQSQDPRDSQLKDLSIEEKRRNLGRVDVETMTAPDGTVFEREKGKAGAQWKESLKLPAKPDNPLDVKSKELAIQKAQRELEGEGATPLTPEERAQIGVPEGQPAYKTRTGEIKFGPAGTKITNDLRQESAFGKATGEAIAKRFDEMATEGDAAAQNLDAINQLKALGTNIGTGGPAVVKAFLGKIGVKTDGISDIEAFNSLIDRLTPQQRVPGSGATSDFDAKMFKGSLPTLINTPGGNAIIIDTMEKIVQNRMARGDIAIRAQLPKDDPDHLSQGQALRELRKLQVEAKKASDAVQNFGQPSRSTTPAPQAAPTTPPANGGFRILKVE
jgi:hypothetical protein